MMDKLRVLFFAPVPNFKGGAERSLVDLIDNPFISPALVVPAEGPLSAMAKARGVACEVLNMEAVATIRRPFRIMDGVKVGGTAFRAAVDLNRIARRLKADLVHTNGLKAHAIGLLARRLGGRPTVIHIRDIANTSLERLVWKSFQASSDSAILVSRACWPAASLPANTVVVHNGFLVPRAVRERPPAAPFVVGFVGRIHPSKGLHDLIDAIAKVRAHGVDAEVLVRGAFATETPGYEREIRDQILRLGLTEKVCFDSFVSGLDKIYDRMSVVCVPSTTPDPLPRAVMEAMGLGLTVVATPCGGIPEMIEDGQTGFFATGPDSIAQRLIEVSQRPDLLADIGRRAHERCVEQFAVDRLHREVFHLYKNVLGKPSHAL